MIPNFHAQKVLHITSQAVKEGRGFVKTELLSTQALQQYLD